MYLEFLSSDDEGSMLDGIDDVEFYPHAQHRHDQKPHCLSYTDFATGFLLDSRPASNLSAHRGTSPFVDSQRALGIVLWSRIKFYEGPHSIGFYFPLSPEPERFETLKYSASMCVLSSKSSIKTEYHSTNTSNTQACHQSMVF
jgi:hypothetical protein